MIELNDPVGEARVLSPQGPARHGEHARHLGRIEQGTQDSCAHKAARTGKERYDGFSIGHWILLAPPCSTHKLPPRLHSNIVNSITDCIGEL